MIILSQLRRSSYLAIEIVQLLPNFRLYSNAFDIIVAKDVQSLLGAFLAAGH